MANKQELVDSVAKATGLTKKDATASVDAVFASIEEALKNGEKVQLIGFGNFEVRDRAARKGLSLIHISEPTRRLMASRMPSSA